MKKPILFLFAFVFIIGNISAQVIGVGSLTITATTTPATACTAPCDGTATLNVTGGTPPYTYIWITTTPMQSTQTATGLCPGIYDIKVMDSGSGSNGSTLGTATVTCNTANDVNALSENDNINVFPNPAFNELYVQFNSSVQGNAMLSVTGIFGAEVYRDEFEVNGVYSRMVDVSLLPSGIYNVKLTTSEYIISKQFVKQ